MKTTEMGLCPECHTYHKVEAPGALRGCGVLCSLAVAAGTKHPGLALLLFGASLHFGDELERWLRARCPVCGIALRLVAAAAR